MSRYKIGPVFTPPVVSKAEGPLATLALGAAGGGTNWPGGSYDPETHILYVFSQSAIAPLGLVPPPIRRRPTCGYIQGNAASGARTTAGAGGGAATTPLPRRVRLPGGRRRRRGRWRRRIDRPGPAARQAAVRPISAIDLDKGEIIWQIAHGETPDEHSATSGAQRAERFRAPAARERRHARDQDAGDRRRSRLRHRRRPDSAARCCAPTTRRPARSSARSTCRRRRAARR